MSTASVYPPTAGSARGTLPRNALFALSNLMFIFQGLVGYAGVWLGWLPQNPTDDIAFALVALAYHGPFLAFLDAPGERRTTTERMRLFVSWWLVTAISAAVFWEIPWFYLEDNLLRLDVAMDRFHEDLRHLWIFWGYGIADNRFLQGDPTVLSIEFMSAHTSVALIPLIPAMRRGSATAYQIAALGLAGVAYITWVYVLSEFYVGWPNISDRPYDFWVKFLFTQTPYMFYGLFAGWCAMQVATDLTLRRLR